MSDFGRCPKCGKFSWLPHSCKEFQCSFTEDDPDWHSVYATGNEAAVEHFVERFDCENEYPIVQAGECGTTKVFVRSASDPDDVQLFRVTGETVPEYHARPEKME